MCVCSICSLVETDQMGGHCLGYSADCLPWPHACAEHGKGGVATSVQHHGKEMSYNNYLDADAAYSAGERACCWGGWLTSIVDVDALAGVCLCFAASVAAAAAAAFRPAPAPGSGP